MKDNEKKKIDALCERLKTLLIELDGNLESLKEVISAQEPQEQVNLVKTYDDILVWIYNMVENYFIEIPIKIDDRNYIR